MLITILCLLQFLVSVVRQHKFIELGLWSNNAYKKQIPAICIFYTYIISPSHAAIKISINATAAEFICKNIFPTPVQVKKIIKNKIGDIQQIYLYQNVCK